MADLRGIFWPVNHDAAGANLPAAAALMVQGEGKSVTSRVKEFVGTTRKNLTVRSAAPGTARGGGSPNTARGSSSNLAAAKKGSPTKKRGPAVVREFNEIACELTLNGMVSASVGAIQRLLQTERASVFLVDRQANQLIAQTGAAGTQDNTRLVFSLDTGLTGAVAKSGMTEVVEDVSTDQRFDSSFDEKTGFKTRNLLLVPVLQHSLVKHSLAQTSSTSGVLVSKKAGSPKPTARAFDAGSLLNSLDSESATGTEAAAVNGPRAEAVLVAINRKGGFGEDEVSVLELLASLMSGALARATLMEVALREKRRSDALLQLSNVLHSEALSVVQKAARVMDCVRVGLECERASMILVDEVNQQQVVVSSDRTAHGLRFPISAGGTTVMPTRA